MQRPRPKLKTVTDPPGFAVRAKLRVPLDLLGEELNRQLNGRKISLRGAQEIVVTRVSLVNTKIDPAFPR